MWILFWRKYAFSKFATFVSVIGALTRYAGVTCFFESEILAGLICIAIGIGLHFGAEAIAKNKEAKAAGEKDGVKNVNFSHNKTKPDVQSATESVQTTSSSVTTTQTTYAYSGKNRCSKCGAFFSSNSKFCSECGNTVIDKTPKSKKCIRCGEIVDNGSKFCSQCGYTIK